MTNQTDALDAFPRTHFAFLPTPLQRAARLEAALTAELGVCPELWIKRDDCTGLATGGNKTRKLEFLIGAAQARKATTVITFGALQSNHARQTAAACALAGIPCELILSRRVQYDSPTYEHAGNLLLDDLLGATVHRVEPADVPACFAERKAELTARGETLYVIPAGGSNVTGALGYVNCALELHQQLATLPEHGGGRVSVVHASSSAGTQAGLVAGFALADAAATAQEATVGVLGFNVYEPDLQAQETGVVTLTEATAALIGLEPVAVAGRVHVNHDYLGEDYGIPTDAMVDAVRLVARTEGILLDPVYSGKAMSGLLGEIRTGAFDKDERVVFLHTGGAASLDAYAETLLS